MGRNGGHQWGVSMAAYGEVLMATDRNVDVHVRNLRRKIERDPARPERLVTVRGVGYQLLAA